MASRAVALPLAVAATTSLMAAIALTSERTRAREKPSVEELIKRLGSDDFETREAATRALYERPEAEPALRNALDSDSAEVRRRAQDILDEFKARARKERFGPLLDRIKNGEVNLFVEQLMNPKAPLDDEVWDALLDLAQRVVAKSNKVHGQKNQVPPVKPRTGKWPIEDPRKYTFGAGKSLRTRHLVLSKDLELGELTRCLVVTNGRVRAGQALFQNIFFALGDIVCDGPELIHGCIVICDGSVKGKSAIGSIIIATGTVTLEERVTSSSYIVEHARDALGLVKFYDVRQAGIDVEQTKAGLVVKKVADGKPFARGGVRTGDRLLSADGKKITTVRELRLAAVRGLVARRAITFTVERDGKGSAECKVELTD